MRSKRAYFWVTLAFVVGSVAILKSSAYVVTFAFVLMISLALAQSWDWVGGLAGYINLGHFAFYGIGAYAFGIFAKWGIPVPISLTLAAGTCAVIAIALSFPLFRMRGDYFAFATLALLPFAELLGFNLTNVTGGADGLSIPPATSLSTTYICAAVLALSTIVCTLAMLKNRFGYALRSIKEDEQAAEVVGVPVWSTKVAILTMSAVVAALAGGVQAWQFSYIDPPTVFGLQVGLVPIAMALLGGSGLLLGPLVGVVLLSCLQQWLLVNVTMLQAYGVVMLLVGRFLPGGLLRAKFIRLIPFLQHFSRTSHVAIHDREGRKLAGNPVQSKVVSSSGALLELRDVRMAFGGNIALRAVSTSIWPGEIVGLIGTNGSGKTTLFNCISRVYRSEGTVLFEDSDVSGFSRAKICHAGIGRTFQNPKPFSDLTTLENIAVAAMFRPDRLSLTDCFDEAASYANFVGLGERLNVRSADLGLQERKSLELARALALKPKLLLVDEIASGLTPVEIRQFVDKMKLIRDLYGVTIIWVEHIFSALAQAADRLIVMEQGAIIADGSIEETINNQRVIESYLGSEADRVTG